MKELTYTRCGDYYIPDLKLSEQPEAPIGKYGRMRQRYLKEHHPGLYSSLILSEKLYSHLLEVDRAAQERLDTLLPRMMETARVTEELKARDPMRWMGLMNTLKAQVEELILSELILNYYCSAGRIPDAVKMAKIWLVPKDAEKPVDMRTKQASCIIQSVKDEYTERG